MWPERPAIGALGVLLAAMALASLAARAPDREPAEPPRTARASSGAALRALRDGAPIDLDRARAADLELLPGIGPQLAARIIEHRERHGPFRSLEELTALRGIGARTLERLRPLLRVGAQDAGVPAQDAGVPGEAPQVTRPAAR